MNVQHHKRFRFVVRLLFTLDRNWWHLLERELLLLLLLLLKYKLLLLKLRFLSQAAPFKARMVKEVCEILLLVVKLWIAASVRILVHDVVVLAETRIIIID